MATYKEEEEENEKLGFVWEESPLTEASKFGHAAWARGQMKILRISVALAIGTLGHGISAALATGTSGQCPHKGGSNSKYR